MTFLPAGAVREPLLPHFVGFSLRLFLLCSFVLFLNGCGRKQLTKSDVHTITQEFVSAAQRAAGRTSEIAIRPEQVPVRSPQGRSATIDHIYVTLADPAQLGALEAAFDRVARRHRLQLQGRRSASGIVRLDYRLGDSLTHEIHIVSPLQSATLQPRAAGRPLLAIIIDDLGYDAGAADVALGLPFPITVSVLPDLPHSTEIAEEARRRGYEVLLHLPMQSQGGARHEVAELHAGMTQAEVARLLSEMLESVPGAVGVNNHQGSLATTDTQLMAEVMPVLRERGLFFIDSRTTAATVAYQAAQSAHVRAAYRNVFLDDSPKPESIRHELERAESLARKQGWSIAIGHPHPATLETLKEDLPRLEARGVRLVFASELAK